jgi:phospholipase C
LPFHSDFTIRGIENGVAILEGSTGNLDVQAQPPGQTREHSFMAAAGQMLIQASAGSLDQPGIDGQEDDPGQDHWHGAGTGGHGHPPTKLIPYYFAHARIEVLDSDSPGPDGSPGVVASFEITPGVHPGVNGPMLWFQHDLKGLASKRPVICRITNLSNGVAKTFLKVTFCADRLPVHSQAIPVATLNHAYQVVLEALTPKAAIYGNHISITFGEELQRFFNNAIPQLQPIDTGNFSGTGALTKFVLHAVPGQELLDVVQARFLEDKKKIDAAESQIKPNQPDTEHRHQDIAREREKLREWRESFNHIGADWPAVRANVAFTTIAYAYESWVGSIDLGELEQLTAAAYLTFDNEAVSVDGVLLASGEVEGLAELAEDLGILPGLIGELEQKFRDLLTSNADVLSSFVGRYFGETLAKLCNPDAIFLDVTADPHSWTVRHVPLHPKEITGTVGETGGKAQGGTVGIFLGGAGAQPGAVEGAPAGLVADAVPAGNPAGGLGVVPAEFKVLSPTTLAALDEIETIVVVMMENRSFDHMLGYLRQLRPAADGLAYEGFSGNEVNNVQNAHPGFKMLAATKANIPGSVTAIYPGPEHGFDHVARQVAGGAMSGFAQDYEERYPDDGIGQWVLTYYTDHELPVYYDLAAHYAVCDHWFASHPGPTWPNRWTTLSGGTPFTDNPPVTNKVIGFLPYGTIFDLLNERGIDWRVFESDLSLIRTYDNFRLDADHVVPFINPDDDSRSFEQVAAAGRLPPVVFVEPNFSDTPPLSTANDDLCPIDLVKGQDFVHRVYNALRDSPHWPRTLLLITYDEHGGFFDHVPPPGTPLGPPEWIGKVPKIHPEGADHLGVRVPALVVSPWVRPGSVCKQVFDHTSIIKTILLRHRAKLQTADFVSFGPRVNEAAHLGIALNGSPSAHPAVDPMSAPAPRQVVRRATPTPPLDMGRPDVAPEPWLGDALYQSFLPHRDE